MNSQKGSGGLGVVVFQLGGPDSLAAVEPFLYNLFSDPDIIDFPLARLARPVLARLISSRRARHVAEHYAGIGGKSPIRELTERQAAALERELRDSRGLDARVFVAMRYWHPLTEAAVEQVRRGGFRELVLLPLYPQYSRTTTGSSLNEWRRLYGTNGNGPVPARAISHFYDQPQYLDALVEKINQGLARFDPAGGVDPRFRGDDGLAGPRHSDKPVDGEESLLRGDDGLAGPRHSDRPVDGEESPVRGDDGLAGPRHSDRPVDGEASLLRGARRPAPVILSPSEESPHFDMRKTLHLVQGGKPPRSLPTSGQAASGAAEDVCLVFSAHGVPVRVIEAGDPYQQHIEATVRLVMERGGWANPHGLCYQSRVNPGKWLEPSLGDTLRTLAARGAKRLLVVPISFVTDHVETLAEINIEARHLAHQLGLGQFELMPALNDSPAFIRALADLVLAPVGSATSAPISDTHPSHEAQGTPR